jgi:hypothetical protein
LGTPGRTRATAAFERLLNSDLGRLAAIIAGWKLLTFAAVALGHAFVPGFDARWASEFHYPPDAGPSIWAAFSTWDSSRYLYLAEQGYSPGDLSNWFAPLYPLMISALNVVTGSSIASGLIIANAASTGALFILFAFVKERFGPKIAARALILLLAFPTAFFLNLIYTEALFLLFSGSTFWALYRRNYGLAALAAFPLPMTRLIGGAVLVPFALRLLVDSVADARQKEGRVWLRTLQVVTRRLPYLLGPVAGIAAYFAFMHFAAEDAFAASKAQQQFGHWDLKLILDPLYAVKNFFGQPFAVHGFTNSSLDRAFFVGFLLSLPLVYSRTDRALFAFYLLMGLQPLFGQYMSYMRYLLLAFPLFIAWASWLSTRSDAFYRRTIVAMCAAQFSFAMVHGAFGWVA